MPRYVYRASDAAGEIRKGIITKNTRQEALNFLRSQNLLPLELSETTGENIEEYIGSRKGKVKRKDVLLFTQQLSSLLKAGVQKLGHGGCGNGSVA